MWQLLAIANFDTTLYTDLNGLSDGAIQTKLMFEFDKSDVPLDGRFASILHGMCDKKYLIMCCLCLRETHWREQEFYEQSFIPRSFSEPLDPFE